MTIRERPELVVITGMSGAGRSTAGRALEDLGFYGMTTCEGMDADPPSNECEKAEKQLTALLLNVCSERLAEGCQIDATAQGCGSAKVGELITEVADLIHIDKCVQAAACADAANTGEALAESGGSQPEEIQRARPVKERHRVKRMRMR